MRLAVLVVLALVAMRVEAAARVVRGIVYDDQNGNDQRDPGEPGVRTVVAFDVRTFVDTAADGTFAIDVTADLPSQILWARVPDGFVPGPAWTRVDPAPDAPHAIALRRLPKPHTGKVTFVVAADTHLTAAQPFASDLGAIARAAVTSDPPPAFFTILGDVTQNAVFDEFELVDNQLLGLPVPFVPVAGNHDWYDLGEAWFRRYGPDNYSFDIGRVHFVVWNMMMTETDIVAYLGAELRRVAPDMTIVALSHAPPVPAIVDRLRALGVDYVLTGHTHTNRVVDHGGLVELTTEPLLMGGLDFVPAGYRVATVDPDAKRLATTHRTVVEPSPPGSTSPSSKSSQLVVHAPSPLACAPRHGSVIVASPSAMRITARLDCGTSIELVPAGGWTYRAALPELRDGIHTLEIAAPGVASRTVVFEVCATPARSITASWPQLGGNAAHTGLAASPLAPPLAPRWSQTLGGHALHASPIVHAGIVYAPATDLADGTTGGLAAFDLATGAPRWRLATRSPVRGSAAILGNVVAIAALDGIVRAVDAKTGAPRWTYDLAADLAPEAGNVFAHLAADADAFYLGNRRRVAALSSDGRERWTADPIPDASYSQSLAAIAIAGDTAVGVLHRELGGVIAWDRATGRERWRFDGLLATAINASPVIDHDTVYVVNGLTEVIALDLATGRERWTVKLDASGFDWGVATIGTPALAPGPASILVVPTLYRDLVALDAATGHERWRFSGTPGPLRTTHYRGAREAGFESSPVIAGDLVWAVDTAGRLAAIELATGRLVWSHELGAPALGSLAIVDDTLLVTTYDGTLHALSPSRRPPVTRSPKRCDVATKRGCCDAGDQSSLVLAIGVALMLRRRARGKVAA